MRGVFGGDESDRGLSEWATLRSLCGGGGSADIRAGAEERRSAQRLCDMGARIRGSALLRRLPRFGDERRGQARPQRVSDAENVGWRMVAGDQLGGIAAGRYLEPWRDGSARRECNRNAL